MLLCRYNILIVGVGVEEEDSKIVSLVDFYVILYISFFGDDDR